jgi:isoleucyl-tRNA synthetase
MDWKETLKLPQTSFPMKANLAEREPSFIEFWEKNRIYEKMLEKRANSPLFILHDGPPYANGHIHLGTALNKILKDIIVKSKSMSGFRVPYVPGWDCHGLPIELNVEKELGVKRGSFRPLS